MKRNYYYWMGVIVAILLGYSTISCKSREQREKEAYEQINKELQEETDKAWQEWLKTERLIEKAAGVTSNVTAERKEALIKFMYKYPNNKHLDGISSSIDREETYEKWQEMIYELKKAEGWRED